MIIVGLNAFHGDSSACLLRDGVLVAAVEEERFTRIKHWAGFPALSIAYCLREAGLQLADVDFVAINSDASAARSKKLQFLLSGRAGSALIKEKLLTRRKRHSIQRFLMNSFPGDVFTGQIVKVEHHLAHMASSFLSSEFNQALVLSVDGFGDFSSCAWGMGVRNTIDVHGRVFFPHSLGIFYQAMTQYLGFHNYGDEYKVMGLAPYGKPHYVSVLDQVLRLSSGGGFTLNLDYFNHHKDPAGFEWDDGVPKVSQLYTPVLEGLLGVARDPDTELSQHHFDLARSVQLAYENAFFSLLRSIEEKTACKSLALSGGCAMNSVANGKIYRKTGIEKVYVQAAAGDAGGAVGAAMIAAHAQDPELKRRSVLRADFGPSFTVPQIEAVLAKYENELITQKIASGLYSDKRLFDLVSERLSEGALVGWFQGRMEWGARALGNRSILADPRRSDMKTILNKKIKKRESFRPFAPSILREEVAAWFETDDDVPFMAQVFQIKEDRRLQIPAVTHVDGSGRLQTVGKFQHSRYHRLISQFFQKTGVPILLNTSFNENEPIVCAPQEAIECFLRTDMDLLVMENIVLSRIR